MAVATIEAGVLRTGNGVVVEFAFPFRAQVPADIKVASVVGQVLTVLLPATYTVLLAAASGTVTFGVAPLNGAVIYIYRETAQTQLVSVSSQNAYNPTVVEGVWDKLTMLAQELSAAIVRSVKVAPGGNANTLVSQIIAAQAASAVSAAEADADRIAAAASAAAAATFVPANFFDRAGLLSGISAGANQITAQTNLGLTEKGRALAAAVSSNAFTAGTNAQGQGPIPVDTALVIVTTAAANPSGVTLPVATLTSEIVVMNTTVNTVNVYPVSGSTIGERAVNLPIAVLPRTTAAFLGETVTSWRVISSTDDPITAVLLTDAAATLIAAHLIVNRVFTITPTVARILTTATAAQIIAALPRHVAGANVAFTIVNLAPFDVTLAAGAGVTIVGGARINNGSGTWRIRVDSASAVTIYTEAATINTARRVVIPSAVANVNISLPAGFKRHRITIIDWKPVDDGVGLFLRVSTDGGTTFNAGAIDYQFNGYTADNTTLNTISTIQTNALTLCSTATNAAVGNAAAEWISGTIEILNAADAGKHTRFETRMQWDRPDGLPGSSGIQGKRDVAQNTDTIRLLFFSGNIASGEYVIESFVE